MKFEEIDEAEEGSIFESFSDMIFCVCVVLLALVGILALNVSERFDEIVSPNRFTGGIGRPEIYLSMHEINMRDYTEKKDADDANIFLLALYSPSAAKVATFATSDGIASVDDAETFSSMTALTANQFVDFFSGVQPGSFTVNGHPTSLMLPIFVEKDILYGTSYLEKLENEVTINFLRMMWPVFEHKIYPLRAYQEYQSARTKIYVESHRNEKEDSILIGQCKVNESDLKEGWLDFLLGLASGCTEIVYLGEYWEKEGDKEDRRSDYLKKNSSKEIYQHYVNYNYGNMKPEEKKKVQNDRDMELSRAIRNREKPGVSMLPTFFLFPDERRSYIKYCISNVKEPPDWFVRKFLIPLGFDRRMVKGE